MRTLQLLLQLLLLTTFLCAELLMAHPFQEYGCPVGSIFVEGSCYCVTTGKMQFVERGGICPDNPYCQFVPGESVCDGNPVCCCSIHDEIFRGAQCKGCMQLDLSYCYGRAVP